MAKTDIDEILKGCVSGNRKAQGQLFQLFGDEMFGVCLYYSKDYAEAEDTLHEGFMKVFQKVGQYSGKGSFAGWIKRVIINTALEKHRKQNKMFAVGDDILNEEDIEPEKIVSNLSKQDLLKLVQELSPMYRLVFNLYAIEGYSHKEVSEMLGISEGTSKSNLARARRILQDKVKKYYYVDDSIKDAQ